MNQTSYGTQRNCVSEPRTYKVEDIAKMLCIGRTSAYQLVKEGHFKTVRIGSTIRISKNSFDEWLDSQTL
ncbi:MAG: helix-turn-helix domain-containing protein [Anaerotignum propionicum]|uniref:helix-turn-helix domain-containing protein n=1 Tax=Anaerotignum propionicum TaxID=28446 RepID=UPI002B1F10E4|nr:helix-turn-helix domain-containing protein [Anaerotignum propionicum]MEA5056663.1 helix-turn-helix domain-containing protein [Anaerotignum propionicum]